MRLQRRSAGVALMIGALVVAMTGMACGDDAKPKTAPGAAAEGDSASVSSSAAAAAEAPNVPRDAAEALEAASLQVFVERDRAGEENGLHSEFYVNDHLVNIFTTDSSKPIGMHMKPAWNTFTLKTTRIANAPSPNGLGFAIGPVHHDPQKDAPAMRPILWSFGNQQGWDWDRDKGYSFRLDPALTTTVHTYHVFFAGLFAERAEVREGDYVLTGEAYRSGENVPFTGTIFINDHPLNSFTIVKRQLVITPLLKPGKNEIKLITKRVEGAVLRDNNDLSFTIAGPAQYNAREKKFHMKPVADFTGSVGWKFDEKTGAAISKDNPASDTVERSIPLFLDELPVPAPPQ